MSKMYMKAMKVLQVPMMLAAAFLLVFLLRGTVSAAEAQTIIPSADGAGNASTCQYEAPAHSKGITVSAPVLISRAGEVNMTVTVASESNAIRIILSKNPSLHATDDWLDCVPNLQAEAGNLYTISLKGYAEGACTWYLHLTPRDDNRMSVSVSAWQDVNKVTTGGELKKGKWKDGYIYNEEHPAYFKIKAASSGCIKVETTSDKTITLLNSKKKEFSFDTENKGKTVYYAVKKGTYNLKVAGEEGFRIRYTLESIKTGKNTKRAKAALLKKGKTQKGMFPVGSVNNNHWYKFTLEKDKTIKLNIKTRRNDAAGPVKCMVLWEKSGKKDEIRSYGNLKPGAATIKMRLKKGTYYVSLDGGIDTGSYSIQWK